MAFTQPIQGEPFRAPPKTAVKPMAPMESTKPQVILPAILSILENHLRMIWWGGIAVFALWRIIRMLAGFCWLKRATLPSGAILREMGSETSVFAGLGVPRLTVCRQLTTPLLIGWVKPSIFLPEESSRWDTQKLEAVLLHELTHWQRRDGWWQSLAALANTIWWWNPLVWFAVRQLKKEAEQAADDMVVLRQHNAPNYAQALVEIAATAAKQGFPMGVAMVGRSSLETRIRAILSDNPWRGKLGKLGSGMAVSLTCVFLVLGGLYLRAQSPSAHTRVTDIVDIIGTVTDQSGHPIRDAKVKVIRIGMITPDPNRSDIQRYDGPTHSPSDFTKVAVSDIHGYFAIKDVSHGAVFTLVVEASGYGPDYIQGIVPASGPVQFKLLAVKPSEPGIARGHVVDPQGSPIVGAGVVHYSYSEGSSTLYEGGVGPTPWEQYEATTDKDGNFSLPKPPDHHFAPPFIQSYQAVGVEIFASGFSRKNFPLIPFNNDLRELKLEHGVTVTGRLIKDGTPLPNIEVGINQTNNLAETNLGEIVAKTNQEGRFVLKDVAANDEYEVYGKRDSLGILGIPGRKVIKTGEAGSTVSVGDILVAPGRKIAGRIVLSDGNRQALPPSVQLHVSRLPGTADYQYINLGSDLKFELMVRDQERMVLDAYIPGYEIPHQEGQFGKAIDVTPDLEAIDLVFVPK